MITFVIIRSKVAFFSSKNVAQNLSDSEINKYMFSSSLLIFLPCKIGGGKK